MSAPDSSTVSASRFRRAAAGAAIAAVAIETTTHLLDFGLWNLRVRLLDSSYEWSYSHLLSTLAGAAAGLVCACAAGGARSQWRAWAVAAALFGVLVLDNITRVHESVPVWPVVYAPLFAVLSLAVIRAVARTSVARLAHAALGLLGASLAIHMLEPEVLRLFPGGATSWGVGWGPTGWADQVKVAVKEGTELGGWVLLVPALTKASAEAPRRSAVADADFSGASRASHRRTARSRLSS